MMVRTIFAALIASASATSTADGAETQRGHISGQSYLRRRIDAQDYQIRLRAGEFVSMEGVSIEEDSSIGWLDEGDWAAYNITLPSAGTYDLKIEVASPTGDGSLSITNFENNQEYATINSLPSTGEWQNWENVSVPVVLPEGDITLKMNILSAGWNLLSMELSGPIVFDAKEVNSSENYQHIFESGSLFIPAYEYISMEGIVVESSSEGGSSIGWLDAGDMVTYNISLPSAGVYKLEMRIASPSGNGAFSITDSSNQEFALMTRLPPTGDWQNWQTIGFDLTLPGGSSDLMVNILRSGWNLLWLELSIIDDPAFEPQEEDFRLRIPADEFLSMQGILVESLADGSRYISWLDTDDWVTYMITLPSDGLYRFDMHIASPSGTGAFEISNLDTREVYAFENNMSSTGDWQSWEDVRLNATLPGGSLTLKLQILDPGWNLHWLEISGPLSKDEIDGTPEDDPSPEEDFLVRIIAGEYSSMEGIATETSSEGSDSISSLDAGDNVTYELSLPSGGLYGVELRVASPSGEGAFAMSNLESGDEIALINSLPTTGDWQSWENFGFNVTLPGGFLSLQLTILVSGWKLLWLEFRLLESSDNKTDYDEFQVMINASDFSSMAGVEVEDFPGGLKHVSYLDIGDWVAYNVSVPYNGTYKLMMQISSLSGQGGFEIVDMETQMVYANVNTLPATGSWESAGIVNRIVLLPAGPITLQIRVLQPGWNLVAFSLEKILALTGSDGGGFIVEAPDTINGVPTWNEAVIRDPWTPILEDSIFMDPTVAVAATLGDR